MVMPAKPAKELEKARKWKPDLIEKSDDYGFIF